MSIEDELIQKIYFWEAAVQENLPTIELEEFFKDYTSLNKRFCIEDIYKIVCMEHHALSVNFIPTSPSFKKYGSSLTIVDLCLSDEDNKKYLRAILSKSELHYGEIKCKAMMLDEVVINTSDIYEFLNL